MPYLAHVGIMFADDECLSGKNEWHFIKECDGIEYRWKYTFDNHYHIISGLFNDPNDALKCAKQMYVTLMIKVLWEGLPVEDAGCNSYESTLFRDKEFVVEGYEGNEKYFFWNKQYHGGGIGLGVYEVESSLDEYDEYKSLSAKLTIRHQSDLNFIDIDKYYFLYCREAQEYFNTILLAEQADSYGMKMTMLCGLLEHLSEVRKKDQDVLDVIDQITIFVDSTSLSQEKKNSLKNYLDSGKTVSARQKCLSLCKKYARASYGKYDCKTIIDAAYRIRSAFSHGESVHCHDRCSAYIKYIVLDVIINYLKEKQSVS